MNEPDIHPASLPADQLARQCDVRRSRGSGPGGQHRNKVETAIFLVHRPTDVRSEATERRHQRENLEVATARLRVNLALKVRAEVDTKSPPSPLWQSRCRKGKMSVSERHDDFPAILAEALDAIAACDYDMRSAAEYLGCSTSQLTKLLRVEPRALIELSEQNLACTRFASFACPTTIEHDIMSDADREKWNAKYEQAAADSFEPSELLPPLAHLLPQQGTALDVAGGAGRHAIWLAERGLDVTLADISPVGLALAESRAEAAGVHITPVTLDFSCDELPPGPWDLILSCYFLHRPLFQQYPQILRPGGRLVILQPTTRNLQRHARPPAQFLLDENELPTLVEDLKVIHYEEDWLADGRHQALIVAEKLS